MELSTQTLTIVAVSAAVAAGLALIVALALAATRRRRPDTAPPRGDEAVGVLLGRIERLEKAAKTLNGRDQLQQLQIEAGIRRVGMVRYDAFEDVGGRLSFSCALLDEHGAGVVLTSINGRQDTRVYAKPVAGGTSTYNLSLEEEEAIRQAMSDDREAASTG
jgi:Protein of unknown function (DUF4446)